MKTISLTFIAFLGVLTTTFAQESPFGTGVIDDQDIGVLDDPDVVFASNSGWGNFDYFPDPDELLADYDYDLYIPPSYDGTEAYGLVTWINSGNNGTVKAQWKDILDEKKLIWVGGNDIGNSVFINIRMGVAWAAVLRMKEILNIDDDRIYTSGNSGGARMATTLAYIYPEWISATLPSCGAAFPLEVAQDYETHDPDSHYEIIIPFTGADLDYIKTYDLRYGIMTSFGDFRQGDIMNIYHNGMEPNDMKARFLETGGGHCSTTTVHFEDAVNFVENSFTEIINDPFTAGEPGVGEGFINQFTEETETALLLNGSTDDLAQLKSLDLFKWYDPKGSILRTTVQLDEATTEPENTRFSLGIWAYGDNYCTLEGNDLEDGQAGILLSVDFSSGTPFVEIQLENELEPDAPSLVFSGEFSDWTSGDLDIKYHIWDNELRVEFSNHFADGSLTEPGALLLADKRSVRIRWNEMSDATYWTSDQWESGAFLTMTSEQVNPDGEDGNILVDKIELTSDQASGVHTLGLLSITQDGANLVADDAGLSDYQWYNNDVIIDGEVDFTLLDFATFGDEFFYLTANDVDACRIKSNVLDVGFSGIDLNALNAIEVYPNPSSGQFILSEAIGMYTIYDQTGNTIFNQSDLEIDLSGFSAGIYILVSETHQQKLVKL